MITAEMKIDIRTDVSGSENWSSNCHCECFECGENNLSMRLSKIISHTLQKLQFFEFKINYLSSSIPDPGDNKVI